MDENINKWTIYMYTFPNGKRYIGATTRPLIHRQGSRESGWSRYRNCDLLWEAIQEFGIDNIEQTILFEGDISGEEAAEIERHYIALYKTNAKRYYNPTYGYNKSDGGESTKTKHLTEERKNQLRAQMDQYHKARIGTRASDSTRHRQSIAKKGISRGPLSEEAKKKISIANSLANMSPEERQRRSDSKKQPLSALNPVTGERLFFSSHHEAADYFGVRDSAVSRWLNGTRNPGNGYVFVSETKEKVS